MEQFEREMRWPIPDQRKRRDKSKSKTALQDLEIIILHSHTDIQIGDVAVQVTEDARTVSVDK